MIREKYWLPLPEKHISKRILLDPEHWGLLDFTFCSSIFLVIVFVAYSLGGLPDMNSSANNLLNTGDFSALPKWRNCNVNQSGLTSFVCCLYIGTYETDMCPVIDSKLKRNHKSKNKNTLKLSPPTILAGHHVYKERILARIETYATKRGGIR